jgi:hypothetical protein
VKSVSQRINSINKRRKAEINENNEIIIVAGEKRRQWLSAAK